MLVRRRKRAVRGVSHGSGASWALHPRELGREGGFWAGSGEKEREEEGRLGWAGAGVCGLRWVWVF